MIIICSIERDEFNREIRLLIKRIIMRKRYQTYSGRSRGGKKRIFFNLTSF